jgi:hypothetical protein
LSIKKIRKMRYFLKVAYKAKFICKIEGLIRGRRFYMVAMRGEYGIRGYWIFYLVFLYPYPRIPL